MTDFPAVRHGHATLDLSTREAKGRKIARVLDLPPVVGRKLLEVGTGAGGIAHYFATRHTPSFDVDAVDVTDSRQIKDGYRFTLVDGTELPFADGLFDVVVSNHVIEHVGDRDAQLHHLQEAHRVLREGGKVYLAVPNRWMVIEPHYRLAFLSWLPRQWRSSYLRAAGRGVFYDCEPLQRFEVEALASAAGFIATNASSLGLRALAQLEPQASYVVRILAQAPDALLHVFERIIPTHIYVLERA